MIRKTTSIFIKREIMSFYSFSGFSPRRNKIRKVAAPSQSRENPNRLLAQSTPKFLNKVTNNGVSALSLHSFNFTGTFCLEIVSGQISQRIILLIKTHLQKLSKNTFGDSQHNAQYHVENADKQREKQKVRYHWFFTRFLNPRLYDIILLIFVCIVFVYTHFYWSFQLLWVRF